MIMEPHLGPRIEDGFKYSSAKYRDATKKGWVLYWGPQFMARDS